MKLFRKHEDTLIFSVYQHKNQAEDRSNTNTVAAELTQGGVPFKLVLGFFDDEIEQSFVIPGRYHGLVVSYLNYYNQQCALHIDELRYVYKVLPDHGEVYFGKWRNRGTGAPEGDCTWDPTTGQYYDVEV